MKQKHCTFIEKETAKKLKELRITKYETYDEIINRLINFYIKMGGMGGNINQKVKQGVNQEVVLNG